MLEIWKFALEVGRQKYVEMPVGATVLSAHVQHGAVYVWALVDPTADKTMRRFAVVGTGWGVDSDYAKRSFIGTVQLDGGNLVFHVFEG